MRRSAPRTTKNKLPILVAFLLVSGFMAGMVPLTRAWFSSEQVAAGPGEDRDRARPGAAADISGHRNIYDRGYRELAVSFKMKSLYARPLEIDDIDGVAAFLAGPLGLDPVELGRGLKAERSFVWLGRGLPENRADALLEEGIAGIYAREEPRRFYPARRSGAHVVGFMEENTGLAGIEFSYDHILHRGSGPGPGGEIDGHLQLTLDLRIQELLADGLDSLVTQTGAPSGTGIIMNYQTGAVLAMASLPDYDPNSYWKAGREGRVNRAVNSSLELGGFSALFGLAAVYEDVGAEKENRLAGLKMDLLLAKMVKEKRSAEPYRRVGDEVLSAEFAAWQHTIGAEGEGGELAGHLGLFGRSGIDLPEADGFSDAGSGKATPLSLLASFAGLVNGGRGITPHLGKAIIDPATGRGEPLDHDGKSPESIGPATSRKIVELLTGAPGSGSGAVFLESLRPVTVPVGEDEMAGQDPEELRQRYQTVMLGFIPDESGLAILVALDRAAVACDKKTAMRRMGEDILGRAASLAAERIEPPPPAAMAAGEKRIFETWLGSLAIGRQVAKLAEDRPEMKQPGVMPDLRGLSLRKALRGLQPFEVLVEISGSGRVVEQEPRAGGALTGGECRLALREEPFDRPRVSGATY